MKCYDFDLALCRYSKSDSVFVFDYPKIQQSRNYYLHYYTQN